MALVATADKTETIDFCTFFRGDKDVLARELPPVGHVAFRANMAFVPII
jgi:hypothetical protein